MAMEPCNPSNITRPQAINGCTSSFTMVDVAISALSCSLRADRITPVRNSAAAVAAAQRFDRRQQQVRHFNADRGKHHPKQRAPDDRFFHRTPHQHRQHRQRRTAVFSRGAGFSRSRISRQNGVISTEPQAIETATDSEVDAPSPSTLPRIGRPNAA